MSESEAAEWAEFYRLEPFLADRLEILLTRIGTIFTGKPELLVVSEDFRKQLKEVPVEELVRRVKAVLDPIAKRKE